MKKILPCHFSQVRVYKGPDGKTSGCSSEKRKVYQRWFLAKFFQLAFMKDMSFYDLMDLQDT